jgi:hypothetical protein
MLRTFGLGLKQFLILKMRKPTFMIVVEKTKKMNCLGITTYIDMLATQSEPPGL